MTLFLRNVPAGYLIQWGYALLNVYILHVDIIATWKSSLTITGPLWDESTATKLSSCRWSETPTGTWPYDVTVLANHITFLIIRPSIRKESCKVKFEAFFRSNTTRPGQVCFKGNVNVAINIEDDGKPKYSIAVDQFHYALNNVWDVYKFVVNNTGGLGLCWLPKYLVTSVRNYRSHYK